MACKTKKPKPPKKTIDNIAEEKAKIRLQTIHKARKVALDEL